MRYSISEMITNMYSLLLTKLFFRQCRLLRRPLYIRGKKSIIGGKNLTTGYSCRFDLDGKKSTLFIGENCQFGDNTHVVAYNHVEIGNDVLIASKCFISDTSHGQYVGDKQSSPLIAPNSRPLYCKTVIINENVWIGENVVILAGAEIGKGCIIGANSVITKKIPDYSMVIGNNVVIKRYCLEKEKWERVKAYDSAGRF